MQRDAVSTPAGRRANGFVWLAIAAALSAYGPVWGDESFDDADDAPTEAEIELHKAWAEAIESCSPFEQDVVNPFTGESFKRFVHGVVDERCHVEERLPGDGKMECRYDQERLPALTRYYDKVAEGASFRVKSRTTLVDGEMVSKNEHFLDGEPYDHPIEAALATGECKVSGYGSP